MLIPSDRHTVVDLELWHELGLADRAHGNASPMTGKVRRSIEAIQTFLVDKRAYCGVSWGKDSVVVAHLCWLSDCSIPLIHLRPSNHNPDCDAVRDAYFAAFPGQHYTEVPVDYGDLHAQHLTAHELDKLTDQRWYAAIRESSKPFKGRHILGIRADESGGRKMRMRVWGVNSPNGCAPIGWWSTADVFAYLARYDLPVHPAYAMLGGGRHPRDRLRVAEIGDTHGRGGGRDSWEREFYGPELRRLEAGKIGYIGLPRE